jgi:multiple sugar transport system permease protein
LASDIRGSGLRGGAEVERTLRAFISRHFRYLTTIPSTLIIVMISGFPIAYVIYISFFVRNLLQGQIYFTGLTNYVGILMDPMFWKYLKLTCIYMVMSVAIGFPLSLLIAWALDQTGKVKLLFLSIILLPWLIPVIATSIMWRWLLHDIYGLINIVLLNMKIISAPINWLGESGTAMLCLILTDIWYRNPFDILILYAGMQRVPPELNEAANMDGAGSWRFFRHIVLPEIKPDILIVLVIRTMFVFREVGLPFTLTRGGPGESTEVLAVRVYKLTNLFLRQGQGATISVLMLVITLMIVLAYFRALKRD